MFVTCFRREMDSLLDLFGSDGSESAQPEELINRLNLDSSFVEAFDQGPSLMAPPNAISPDTKVFVNALSHFLNLSRCEGLLQKVNVVYFVAE